MHRIQVQLSSAQERALRELASLRRLSISALIREGVERLLETDGAREFTRKRALDLIGMIDFGLPDDLSQAHDRYIAESIKAGLETP